MSSYKRRVKIRPVLGSLPSVGRGNQVLAQPSIQTIVQHASIMGPCDWCLAPSAQIFGRSPAGTITRRCLACEQNKTSIESLAIQFSHDLQREIGKANVRAAILLNREEDNPSVCHSHDFCDANMTMFHAGTKLKLWDDTLWEGEDRGQRDREVHLFNAAWGLAKEKEFFIRS